jgi:hypothetical protein
MKLVLVLATSTLLAACSSDDRPAASDDWHPLPECPGRDLSACDTRTAACQQKLLSLAGCMYGVSEAPAVPIVVVTEEELLAQLEEADVEGDDASASLPFAEQALVQLGLAQAGDFTDGAAASLVERVDGVYRDAEQGIAIVDRGEPKDNAEANALLLHEMVHAIQDHEYGLDAWREQHSTSDDAELALRSVTEGQATFYQFRALLAFNGRDVQRIDWETSLDRFASDVLSAAYADPSPFLASIVTFPYAYGAQQAYRDWLADGPSFHSGQFAEPPSSTYQVVSTLEGTRVNFGELTFNEPSAVDSAEHELVQATTLGAFLSELHLRRSGVAAATAHELAGEWRGDRLFVYAKPDGNAAWLWQVALASAAAGEAFVAHDLHPEVEAEARDGRAFLAGGSEGAPEVLLEAGRAFLNGE